MGRQGFEVAEKFRYRGDSDRRIAAFEDAAFERYRHIIQTFEHRFASAGYRTEYEQLWCADMLGPRIPPEDESNVSKVRIPVGDHYHCVFNYRIRAVDGYVSRGEDVDLYNTPFPVVTIVQRPFSQRAVVCYACDGDIEYDLEHFLAHEARQR